MKKIKISLFTCLVTLFSILSTNNNAYALESHNLKYQVEFFTANQSIVQKYIPFLSDFIGSVPLSGKLVEVLSKRKDGVWMIERSSLVYGFKSTEFSQFTLRPNSAINTIWYSFNETGSKKGKFKEVRFPKNNTTIFDPITVSLKIALDLQKNPSRKKFSYAISRQKNKKQVRTFLLTRREDINTTLGKFNTVVIEEQGSDESIKHVFWLAPAYGYKMFKSRLIENGLKKSDYTIKSGSIGNLRL